MCLFTIHTKSSTISWILLFAPSTQSLEPLMTTLSLLTPLRGKLTVTPPNSSPMCFRTSPRRATKYLWCLGSTCISPSTTLSFMKKNKGNFHEASRIWPQNKISWVSNLHFMYSRFQEIRIKVNLYSYQVLNKTLKLLLGLVYWFLFPNDDNSFLVSILWGREDYPGTRLFTHLKRHRNFSTAFFK